MLAASDPKEKEVGGGGGGVVFKRRGVGVAKVKLLSKKILDFEMVHFFFILKFLFFQRLSFLF